MCDYCSLSIVSAGIVYYIIWSNWNGEETKVCAKIAEVHADVYEFTTREFTMIDPIPKRTNLMSYNNQDENKNVKCINGISTI